MSMIFLGGHASTTGTKPGRWVGTVAVTTILKMTQPVKAMGRPQVGMRQTDFDGTSALIDLDDSGGLLGPNRGVDRHFPCPDVQPALAVEPELAVFQVLALKVA